MTSPDILAAALQRCRQGIFAAGLFSFFINALMLTAPLYMLQVFDRVLASRSHETLLYLTLIALAAFVAFGGLEVVRGTIMDRVATWFEMFLGRHVLRAGVFKGLTRTTVKSVQGVRDLRSIQGFLSGASVFPIMDMPWTPLFLLAVFALHPVLGWVATVGALALFALALLNEFTTRALVAKAGESNIRSLQQADAVVRNASVVQSMGMLPDLSRRWEVLNDNLMSARSRANRRAGLIRALAKMLRLSLQVGILGAGAWLVLASELTPGGMIAASILMARALAPIDQSISAWRAAMQARDSYKRLTELLGSAPPSADTMPLPHPKGEVAVEAVSYFPDGSDQAIVKKVGFTLRPGTGLGIVGQTAAGKTTLINLLVGTLRPRVGHVRIDGMDVFEWEAADRGRHIGYLPQDVELFNATVRDNIARMRDVDADEVVAAARLANVHDMIMRLPKGYDTVLGEGGALLSGGQRQRLGLARAVFGNPAFVVLDEPASHLDQQGETALVNALIALKQRQITFVVAAHRPNVLRVVDQILVLSAGEIKMLGGRDDVLAKISHPKSVGVVGEKAG